MKRPPLSLLNKVAALALASALLSCFASASFAAREDDDAADLGVSNVSKSETVAPGGEITFVVTVTNGGPALPVARLDDTLPAGTTFVSLSAPNGWACSTPAEGAAGNISCSSGAVAVTSTPEGESVESVGDEFTIVVRADKSASPRTFLSNAVTVSTEAFDPNDENNSASTSVRVTSRKGE